MPGCETDDGVPGQGFHKLTCHNDDYYVDDIRMNRTDMMTFLMGLSGYLITGIPDCSSCLGHGHRQPTLFA